jgi:hypothetical protein
MKKVWLYFVGLVLIAAAVIGIALTMRDTKNHADKSGSTNSSASSNSKAACSIFTLADAKQVLGSSAKGGEKTGETSSGDLEVSTCSYTQDTGSSAPVSATKSASLLVRSAKSPAGATSNQNQFGVLKPTTVQDVAGYGDSAYWDPQYGQLDILKNSTWYILSNGPITPSARTLDQAKQLADVLISKM